MTARHAGVSRIADQALIDQVTAAADELKRHLRSPLPEEPQALAKEHFWLSRWAGRTLAILEQIGEMGE